MPMATSRSACPHLLLRVGLCPPTGPGGLGGGEGGTQGIALDPVDGGVPGGACPGTRGGGVAFGRVAQPPPAEGGGVPGPGGGGLAPVP